MHEDKCMGEYEIEAWWSGIGLGLYYSKLEVSAFIDIGTGLTSLDFAGPL